MIYLDYQSTTPLDPRIYVEMKPYFEQWHGNPHAVIHSEGFRAKRAVDQARQKIAAALGVMEREIIFTSGATESNNLAILGLEEHLIKCRKTHLITQVTEHPCVLECFRRLEKNGFEVTFLSVDKGGRVDPGELQQCLRESTGLVSIMAVNNEIGVIQPLSEVAKVLKDKNILFHCDAAQAMGRIPIQLQKMGIDLLSISGHKIYGPKGIGALYINQKIQKHINPIIYGGGQESGLRAGTLPTPLCVGLGEAVRLANNEQKQDHTHISSLRDLFLSELSQANLHYTINGSRDQRIPGNLNLSFRGVSNEDLIAGLSDLCISSGSACATEKTEHSHVIQALRVKPDVLKGAVRISFGRFTTEEEIKKAASIIFNTIRSMY